MQETENDRYLQKIIEDSQSGGDGNYRFCLKCKGVANSRKENEIEAFLILINGQMIKLDLVLTVKPRVELGYWKFDISLSKIDTFTSIDADGKTQEVKTVRSLIRFYLEDFDNFQPKIYAIFPPTEEFLKRFAEAIADAFRSGKRQPKIVRQIKRRVRNYDVKIDKMITLRVKENDKCVHEFKKIFLVYGQNKLIEPIS